MSGSNTITITNAAIVISQLILISKDHTKAAMAEIVMTAPRLAGNLP